MLRSCWYVLVFSATLATLALASNAALGQNTPSNRRPQATPKRGEPTAAAKGADADEATDVTKKGRDLINKVAFAKTQTARTMADFTAVIDACQQGLQAGVDKNTADYAAKLMAWAHNRRGETMLKMIPVNAKDADRTMTEQKALAEFEAAIQLDATCWRAFHNHGVSLAQMRDFDGALADFDKAIAINAKYADAWFNRGEIKLARRKYAEAIADYTAALQLNPNDSAAYSSRGHARWGARQYQAAIEDYNRAIQINPKSAMAFTNRAMAYNDQGQYDRAALDYRKAIELNPNLGAAYQGAAWLMATCPDERFRDSKKAVEAATKALEIDGGDDYRYMDTLAAAYAASGRYDDAQSTMKEALKHAPQDKPEVLKELGERQALYEQGKPYRDVARVSLRGEATRR